MAQKTNSFESFWKELNRRKVIHVITVYAAVSFVILQLVDIVEQPLRLPAWTTALVIVLLCIGFIVAVFVSWVYDITPSGVRKTKPTSAIKHSDHPVTLISSGWKVATYVSAIIIIALLVSNFINKRNLNADISKLEKSIAVLPFRNDSRDSTNQYFINGIMEMITTNLQMVNVLRVVSRTSVEQYRNNKTKSISEIAKELDVNYIIEGSGQKYGNSFSVTTQLIKAKGKETHLWANTYEQEIKEVNDYIRIESQIAQAVATELKATITPEEKQLIGKTPTADITAYDFYQRGKEEEKKYYISKSSDKQALERAKKLYATALKYDSRYAKAYAGLAKVYWDKHYWEEYFSKNFLDSVLYLCDIALSIDPQVSEAHTLKGAYFKENGKLEQSLEEFNNALKINPNDWMALLGKGEYYWDSDLINLFYYLQKSISINRGPELPSLLREIGGRFLAAGFPSKSKQYYQDALKLDGDSVEYYSMLASDEFWLENFDKSIEFGLKGYAIDSTNNLILEYLGAAYQWLGNHKESLDFYKRWLNRMKPLGYVAMYGMRRIGLAYWQNGYKKEAEFYFNEQINYSKRMNELGRPWGQSLITYGDLASVYSFKGEKEKAYTNLQIYNQIQKVQLWQVMIIKTDPLFNSIRNEPEFQQIIRDFEAKYSVEHERVRKWIEEQGTL